MFTRAICTADIGQLSPREHISPCCSALGPHILLHCPPLSGESFDSPMTDMWHTVCFNTLVYTTFLCMCGTHVAVTIACRLSVLDTIETMIMAEPIATLSECPFTHSLTEATCRLQPCRCFKTSSGAKASMAWAQVRHPLLPPLLTSSVDRHTCYGPPLLTPYTCLVNACGIHTTIPMND